MTRTEINVVTREVRVVTLTPEEEAEALACKAAWDAAHTPDACAAREVDATNRLLFEINFNQENRIRALEGKAPISKAVYRNALIARWKVVYP